MNRILSTTAIAAMLMAAPALAEQHTSEGGSSMSSGSQGAGDIFAQVPSNPDLQLGTDLIGSTVYSTMAAAQQSAGSTESGSGSESTTSESGSSGGGMERQNIGEINDVIVTQDGQIDYVIVGVGGFLGIGQRSVAVNMDAVEYVQDPENQGEYMLTIPATQEQIENAPEFDPASLQAGSGGGSGEGSSSGSSESGSSSSGGEQSSSAAQEAGQAAQDAENAAEGAAQDAQNAAEGAAQDAQNAAEQAGDSAEQAADEATSSN